MVIDHLYGRDVADRRVLEAMAHVPRERFIDADLATHAYNDTPLNIGQGQTISQPYMVAKMSELAEVGPGSRVLEIGGGSGYQTAVLLELGAHVWSLEILEELAGRARSRLHELGYKKFKILCRDGFEGLPEQAPFDAIVLTAAPYTLPRALAGQLVDDGRLVAPLGPNENQRLHLYRRTATGLSHQTLFSVRFVPMTGRALYED